MCDPRTAHLYLCRRLRGRGELRAPTTWLNARSAQPSRAISSLCSGAVQLQHPPLQCAQFARQAARGSALVGALERDLVKTVGGDRVGRLTKEQKKWLSAFQQLPATAAATVTAAEAATEAAAATVAAATEAVAAAPASR